MGEEENNEGLTKAGTKAASGAETGRFAREEPTQRRRVVARSHLYQPALAVLIGSPLAFEAEGRSDRGVAVGTAWGSVGRIADDCSVGVEEETSICHSIEE